VSDSVPSIEQIQHKVAAAAFGKPLITNVHRGLVVEAIVACALEPEWRWCSEDYSSWDFEQAGGLKLEVKQSSARQSWADGKGKPSASSFDIAKRTGRWEGGTDWIAEPGRNADIYVFAHHPIFDDTADHRDPAQWAFYVISTNRLPDTKRITLGGVRALSQAVQFHDLKRAVAEAHDGVFSSGAADVP
jgi:hypothetical protein